MFAVLPTGYGGKSLCYGCLPWTYDSIFKVSIVVVASPLTAIIEEQV